MGACPDNLASDYHDFQRDISHEKKFYEELSAVDLQDDLKG
jgi:hypothetical protein